MTTDSKTRQQSMQQAIIRYKGDRAVNIGDVFYRIEPVEFFSVYEKCPMCNDTHTITVNGITDKCPHCGKNNTALTISNMVVKRYRVYSIRDKVSDDTWKPDDNHRVTVNLYHKDGRGFSMFGTINREERIEDLADTSKLNKVLNTKYYASNSTTWFDDYKQAVIAAKQLNDAQMAELTAFNEQHGTNHAPSFTKENDPKSR